jgi:NAD(P)-dependent dehydrogenase (short-subunit alcohol dehydrogenase family)
MTPKEDGSDGKRTLKGKTLFVTGASRGIGLAIAIRAAQDGANIAIAAKTVEPHPKLTGTIHTAAAAIDQAGGTSLAIACDIRDEAAVKSAVDATVARFGGIDILVNNASAISLTGTLDTPAKRFDLMWGVNGAARSSARRLRAASQGLGRGRTQPAHPEPRAAAQFESQVVQGPRRVHDREVRDEPVRTRNGGRVSPRRHRRQRAVAPDRDRHRGDRDAAGR